MKILPGACSKHPRDAGGVLPLILGAVLFLPSLPFLLPLSLQASSTPFISPAAPSLSLHSFLSWSYLLFSAAVSFLISHLTPFHFPGSVWIHLYGYPPQWLIFLLEPSSCFLSSPSIFTSLSSIFHLALYLTNMTHFSQVSFQALKRFSQSNPLTDVSSLLDEVVAFHLQSHPVIKKICPPPKWSLSPSKTDGTCIHPTFPMDGETTVCGDGIVLKPEFIPPPLGCQIITREVMGL